MDKKLEAALLKETKLEDLTENCRVLVELIGIENVVKLSKFSGGDEIYFPKTEAIIREARNRRILEEYNGYNERELAVKYGLTTDSIRKILKGYDPKQMSISDFL